MYEFARFQNSSLDTSGIGLWTDYPCDDGLLPAGARMIGWANPEVVAFCFLPQEEETVFLVDIAAPAGEQIRPVAASFLEFLGVLTVCGTVGEMLRLLYPSSLFPEDAAPPCTPKQQSILRAIRNTYPLPSIPDPQGYLMAMQEKFSRESSSQFQEKASAPTKRASGKAKKKKH